LVLDRLEAWNAAAPQPNEVVLKEQVQKKIEEIYSGNKDCFRAPVIVERVQPASADRYAFNAILRGAIRNAWFITTRQPSCENVASRYMVMQNSDGSFQTIRVNRGQSYAWESLIGDTFRLAKIAASVALVRQGVECSPVSNAGLGVVRIASEDEDLGNDTFGVRYSGSWAEIWPVEICERTVEVHIDFRADGDGGAYSDLPGDKLRVLEE
jgi:hypothetical protein